MKRFPAKEKIPDNPFCRKTRKWFLERIDTEIMVKHPAGFESVLKIESKIHADVLCKTRQNKDGYFFSDMINGKKDNRISPRKFL